MSEKTTTRESANELQQALAQCPQIVVDYLAYLEHRLNAAKGESDFWFAQFNNWL